MKKRTRKPGGPVPPASKVADMRALGYALPAELAETYDVSASCIYTWARAWARGDKLPLPEDPKRPATFKQKGNVWVLVAAVRAKLAIPVAADPAP